MAEPARTPAATGTGGATHHGDIDWLAAERSPEFQELVHKRRSFVVPALGFVFVWYFGFIALAGYAPEFMGESVIEGLTIGYLFALSQFVMTWVLAWLYLRRAKTVFDPLANAAAKRAVEAGAARGDGRAAGANGGPGR
jgi:uncharacterized membrane protein (DUF485 family)